MTSEMKSSSTWTPIGALLIGALLVLWDLFDQPKLTSVD